MGSENLHHESHDTIANYCVPTQTRPTVTATDIHQILPCQAGTRQLLLDSGLLQTRLLFFATVAN
jgi:hypothetical protein